MASAISLKVYNKEDKRKLLVQETSSLKIINIYKYDEENVDCHSYTIVKDMDQHHADRITYYDFSREEEGMIVERVWLSNKEIEHLKIIKGVGDVKITKNLESGNVYEKRSQKVGADSCSVTFKNEEMFDIRFTVPENKINEYLEKLDNGK